MNPPLGRIRRIFRISEARRDVDAELDAELEFHFEEAVRRLVAEGWSTPDAEREAERRFGDRKLHEENIRRVDRARRRGARRRDTLSALFYDLRIVSRGLVRERLFSVAVVLTLAVGIGANVAIFGVVDRLFLSAPSAIDRPDELRVAWVERRLGDRLFTTQSVSYPDVAQLASAAPVSDIASVGFRRALVIGEGPESSRADVQGVSANYFDVVGVGAAAGRVFGAGEGGVNGSPSTVLSYDYWRAAFGADPGVIGRTIRVGRHSVTVVGVAEPGFTGLELVPVDLWIPLSVAAAETRQLDGGWATARGFYWLQALVRLTDANAVDQAESALTTLHRRGRADDRFYDPEARIVLASILPGRRPERSSEHSVSLWLGGVSIVVFLIACANVANLLLTRAVRRRRDLAVRLALGVSRLRAMRTVLLEAGLLSLAGSIGAVLVAWLCSGLLASLFLPPGGSVPLNVGATAILLGVAIALSTIFAGLVPAIQVTRRAAEPVRSLSRGTGTVRSTRAQTGFLVAQAGLSTLLLVGAGLFLRSLDEARRFDLGFRPDGMVSVSLDAMNPDLDATERERMYERALEVAQTVPGVESAAVATSFPFGSIWQVDLRALDADSLVGSGPYVNSVTPQYHAAGGISIVEGRAFDETDGSPAAPPVAIVSRQMAQVAWPGRSAVGQCLLVGSGPDPDVPPPCTEVVGVAEDVRHTLQSAEPYLVYYIPRSHKPLDLISGMLVRADGDPEALLGVLNRELRAALPELRFVTTRPFSDRLSSSLQSWTLGATVLTIFGALALVVSAFGIFGTLSFQVAQRRRELGLRAALGASQERLVYGTMLRGVSAVLIGLAGATAISIGLAGWIEPLLFQTSAFDLRVYLAVPAMMLATAVVAGLIPSVQATRIDPMEALRSD